MSRIRTAAGASFKWLAILAMTVTTAMLPWILGGAVPFASFVQLCGAIIAASSCLLFLVFSKQAGRNLPLVMIPLLGLAAVATFQLTPTNSPATAEILHDLPEDLDASLIQPNHARSLSPADTRTKLANFLSLSLLALVAFHTLRTPSTIAFSSALVVANGLGLGVVGMLLMFHSEVFSLNSTWKLKENFPGSFRGFATFVNPNGAGGWLCLTLAVAAGCTHWHLKKTSSAPKLRRGRLRISWFGQAWQKVLEFFAELTVWQILSIVGVTFLATCVFATRSRGAMVALFGSVLITAALRSSVRTLPLALAVLATFTGLTFVLVDSLHFSEGVSEELQTLQDFETAVGSRPDHWKDAISAWTHFPTFGSGLGSYRFTSLPFSTSYHRAWFRNADNQYIEALVESGIIGLLLTISIGWIGFKIAIAASRQAKVRIKQVPIEHKLSRRILAGLGTAILVAVLSQGIAASVDFGISLPPASTLLVVIIAGTAGYLNSGPEQEKATRCGSVGTHKAITLGINALLLLAAFGMVKDQWNATLVDQQVVAGNRILNGPTKAVPFQKTPAIAKELTELLKKRPDDPEGLRLLSRLITNEFRQKSLLLATDSSALTDDLLKQRWATWTLMDIADGLTRLESSNDPAAQKSRASLLEISESLKINEAFQSIQKRIPHLPGIPVLQSEFAALVPDNAAFRNQVLLSQRIDPTNVEKKFQLGILAVRLNENDLAHELWKKSVALSSRFQAAILDEAIVIFSGEDINEHFSPSSYPDCVDIATRVKTKELKVVLWEKAEDLWGKSEPPPSEEFYLKRIAHLKATKRPDQVPQLLEAALADHEGSVPLRTAHAQQLEKQGEFREALSQWLHIQYFDPTNSLAAKRIQALRSPPDDR